jgi:hypothetical protein
MSINQFSRARRAVLWSLSCVTLFSLGCGGGVKPKFPTAKAVGVVMLKGQPLASGMVTFESKTTGHSATVPLAAGGKFVIPAIAVGTYDVGVLPPPPTEAVEPGKAPPIDSTIPVMYHSIATSMLKAEVKASGSNEIKLELN